MQSDTSQIHISVPKELKAWIKQQSKLQERSMNYIAVKLLETGKRLQEAQQ